MFRCNARTTVMTTLNAFITRRSSGGFARCLRRQNARIEIFCENQQISKPRTKTKRTLPITVTKSTRARRCLPVARIVSRGTAERFSLSTYSGCDCLIELRWPFGVHTVTAGCGVLPFSTFGHFSYSPGSVWCHNLIHNDSLGSSCLLDMRALGGKLYICILPSLTLNKSVQCFAVRVKDRTHH